jgi:hypothetical protein
VATKYPELVRRPPPRDDHRDRVRRARDQARPLIDVNIHSTEVTSGVAAMHVIQYLVEGYYATCKDEVVVEALRIRNTAHVLLPAG